MNFSVVKVRITTKNKKLETLNVSSLLFKVLSCIEAFQAPAASNMLDATKVILTILTALVNQDTLKLMPSTLLSLKRKSPGFTLIELLVVIAIIGVLATFIVASFSNAQEKSRDARRKSDLDAIKKALELAKSDSTNGSYYPNAASAATLTTPGYIRQLPTDPSTSTSYTYTGGAAGCGPGLCVDYRLSANLENNLDPDANQSQATCPNAYGHPAYIASPANGPTYVVCP